MNNEGRGRVGEESGGQGVGDDRGVGEGGGGYVEEGGHRERGRKNERGMVLYREGNQGR